MFNSLSVVAPDYSTPLSIAPQKVLPIDAEKDQTILQGDGGAKIIIVHSDDSEFYGELKWEHLTAANAAILFDYFNNTSKANAMARTWPFAHPTDGKSYTTRFIEKKFRLIEHAGRGDYAFEVAAIKVQFVGTVS